jgi:hypothetical protein
VWFHNTFSFVINQVLTGSFFLLCPIGEVGWLPVLWAALVAGWSGIPEPRAGAMKELASGYPGILNPYFARVNVRGGPTSLFSLAPNPLLDSLAALSIRVPFHSIIGNRGIDHGSESSDGIVSYRSAHLEGAESEKIVPAGHNLLSNTVAINEIKRILDKNIRERARWPNFISRMWIGHDKLTEDAIAVGIIKENYLMIRSETVGALGFFCFRMFCTYSE